MSVDKRSNGTYRVRWREFVGGPQMTRTFHTKRDAAAFDLETRHSLQHGVYVDPTLGTVPLVRAMVDHVERQPWRYNTKRNAAYAIEHVRGFFGERPIGQVRTSDLQAFVSSLDLEPGTVASIWRYVRSTFRAAHLDGVIGRDPCLRVKLPRSQGEELVVPTTEQVSALRDAAPAHFAVAVVLGSMLGLRSSEATGLTVDRVDFLRREVRVDRQWHGRLDRFEPVKYAASNRSVPAAEPALALIAHHLERFGAGEHGLVLHANGRPLNGNRMEWRWKRTVAAASSTATFHGLRHYFASSLLASGCSIVAVQRALGHSSASITLDTYGHLMPSDADRVRSAIESVWSSAEDSLRTEGRREAR